MRRRLPPRAAHTLRCYVVAATVTAGRYHAAASVSAAVKRQSARETGASERENSTRAELRDVQRRVLRRAAMVRQVI